MQIRSAEPRDYDAIRKVNDDAFEGMQESALVARLRGEGAAAIDLVALEEEQVLGHILLSPLFLEVSGEPRKALALAPMAVAPAWQRKGIGTALVEEAVRCARAGGWEAVIVLGHPDYYRRFGFSPEPLHGFEAPFSGAAFMALELVPGVLKGSPGCIRYGKAFEEVE